MRSRWPGSTCAGIPTTGSTGCAVIAGQAAQQAAHRWGLRLLEDPALDARDAHPAWLPAMRPWCSSIPMPIRRRMRPPSRSGASRPQATAPRRQGLALIARSPGHCLRFALAPGLEDGMAVAYAHRAPGGLRRCRACAAARPRPTRPLLELHTLQALDATLAGASLREVAEGLFGADAVADWHKDSACAPACAGWCGAAMR
jgi:hypothetical protein